MKPLCPRARIGASVASVSLASSFVFSDLAIVSPFACNLRDVKLVLAQGTVQPDRQRGHEEERLEDRENRIQNRAHGDRAARTARRWPRRLDQRKGAVATSDIGIGLRRHGNFHTSVRSRGEKDAVCLWPRTGRGWERCSSNSMMRLSRCLSFEILNSGPCARGGTGCWMAEGEGSLSRGRAQGKELYLRPLPEGVSEIPLRNPSKI